MVAGGQVGAVWLAWVDVDWGETLSLGAELVRKRAVTQCFPPAIGFRLITSHHPGGE